MSAKKNGNTTPDDSEVRVALVQPGKQQQQQQQPSKSTIARCSTSTSVPENLSSTNAATAPKTVENGDADNANAVAARRPPRWRSLGSLRKVSASWLPDFDRLAGVSAGLSWMLPPAVFNERRRGKTAETKAMDKSVRKFYKKQDNLIDQFDRIYSDIVMSDGELKDNEDTNATACAIRLAQLSFFVNLSLAIIKAIAIGLSGSLSVISSLIDSMIDLVSGVVVWIANRQVKTRNPYYYPQGKTRLEPISIVILAVIMSTSTVQIIIKALESIITMATTRAKIPPSFNASSILSSCCVWCSGSENFSSMYYFNDETEESKMFSYYVFFLVGSVIAIKLTLYLLCSRLGSTNSTEALAQDHRNDCISNSTVLIMTVLSRYLWPYFDAIGALGISVYIIYTWVQTLKEQVRLLTGYTAHPDFLKQITYLCLNHHPLVREIDTVRAFHIGNNFLVEVDIVLPAEMSLKESHDIGESLQCKLERLEFVERAFVHLDYESSHHPHSEHKQV